MTIQRLASSSWRFCHENSLLLLVAFLVIGPLIGQVFTGWHEYNHDLEEVKLVSLSLGEYLRSGHFLEAPFENWENAFLQMGTYVMLTIWLRQRGSSESKKPDEEETVDAEPTPPAGKTLSAR